MWVSENIFSFSFDEKQEQPLMFCNETIYSMFTMTLAVLSTR